MRHGKRFNHLGRKPAHRKATLSNMASSLILHKRISTTVAKAKALKKYVEPIITRSKDDTTHSRRMVFKYLQHKESVKELFGDISEKVANRPGGYTRIIRIANRLGDNAEMCMMELVDFNELLLDDSQTKAKTRRGRRKKSSGGETTTQSTATADVEVAEVVEEEVPTEKAESSEEVVAEVVEETPDVVEVTEDVAEEASADVVEEVQEEVVETVEEPAPDVQDSADETTEEDADSKEKEKE